MMTADQTKTEGVPGGRTVGGQSPAASVERQREPQTTGSLLKVQIGPVQEFIAQARSTRDLWSGSFLISWLMAHLVAQLRRHSPETELIFPAVGKGPLGTENNPELTPSTLAWVEGAVTGDESGRKALLPAMPNVLLAIVPASVDKEAVASLIDSVIGFRTDSVWRQIADSCWDLVNLAAPHGLGLSGKQRWETQLSRHWQCAWQLWPLASRGSEEHTRQRKLFASTGLGKVYPASLRENLKPWELAYQLVAHRLDARRNTRDFAAWTGAMIEKDALSGKEEAIIDREWLKRLGTIRSAQAMAGRPRIQPVETLWHLFRNSDALGAISIVKRVWHRAYLIGETSGSSGTGNGKGVRFRRFKREWFYTPSVPGIAAFPWVAQARKQVDETAKSAFLDLAKAIESIREDVDLELPHNRQGGGDWLRRVDWQYFHPFSWESLIADESESAAKGLEALEALRKSIGFGQPSSYYAVLAMDGDGMGRWLSGERLRNQETPGELTQDYHKAISSSLAETAVEKKEALRGLIEDPMELGEAQLHPFQGKLIYAGADDVLAILPADHAIECARHINLHFAHGLDDVLRPFHGKPNFSISAGIAIAHIKEPLQDMVEVAQQELKRAKRKLCANALCLRLFKRSGEQIEWGAKMTSPAFELLELFRQYYRTPYDQPEARMPISGRFPHRLSEVLRQQGGGTAFDKGMRDIALAEFRYIVSRQTGKSRDWNDPDVIDTDEKLRDLRNRLITKADAYADDLRKRKRPLHEFYNLFNIEAFIARQGK
ncbi:MAG TPA: type III-B CRISPR-associated protein Cas10/Cmr2 [Candidatus Limnocylindria bacterium]|jgi:hypothetical protein|nr:type III-B CRISPR-associated protein Cas10/Cmr2 [Candidatus Limnocylindria bacterium]